jgi:porphobilinogen synthase
MDILKRPRRNRQSQTIRNLVCETHIPISSLIQPIFVLADDDGKQEISSLLGINRIGVNLILKEIEECLELGISSFLFLPVVPDQFKDPTATYSYEKNNFYLKAIKKSKEKFPNICIITDVAMDPYSTDGHDGLVIDNQIKNDETLPILAKMAVAQAEAGVDIVSPSDMMDGRVKYIRQELDVKGFTNVSIMAYTAKYASAFYNPYRHALDSAPRFGDKKTYQMNPANSREAILEAQLDTDEGADFIMVKPALSYLDIIYRLKSNCYLPIVAYNVSGEYAMVQAAVKNGWLDEKRVVDEILTSIRRSGADIIITYHAKAFAKWQKSSLI